MMRVLAAAGADPRLPSRDGTTPLMATAGQGYNRGGGSAFIRDRRDFSSYNPVESAALGSTIPPAEERMAHDAVEAALELGADVDAANDAGDTALHAAASHGMNSVIELLTSRGADLRAENRRGDTPLALAVYADGIGGRPLRARGYRGAAPVARGSGGAGGRRRGRRAPGPAARAPGSTGSDEPRRGHAGLGGRGRRALQPGTAPRATGRPAAATARSPRPRPPTARAPSNLADATWRHGGSDGEIFVAIRDGIGPDFAMDAFGGRLAEPDIWHLVNHLKSLR